jgi:glycosyltransferase involved in cell wall biosynthesis
VLRRILAFRADIFHLHFGGSLSRRLLGLSLVCSLAPHARTVLTFHSGGYPSSPEGRAARPNSMAGRILRRIDRLIGVNSEVVDLFLRYGVPRERVRLISPFTFATPPSTEPLPDPLARFFATHQPRLIAVSGLEPEYDLPTQIRALGRVRERLPRAGLAIVGSGRRENDIRSAIAASGYADQILLCGDLPHDVTLRAVLESDLFLRTTLYDGDAISVREALQLGVPVIATNTALRPDGVRLVPVSNEEALAEAIVEQIEQRVSRGKSAVDESDKNLQAVYDLYSELL